MKGGTWRGANKGAAVRRAPVPEPVQLRLLLSEDDEVASYLGVFSPGPVIPIGGFNWTTKSPWLNPMCITISCYARDRDLVRIHYAY